MKDIDEIRRENLRLIEAEFGGPTGAAKAIQMSLAQFSNLRDGAKDSKTGKQRGMRKETARKIEAGAKKPAGWLDIAHSLGADELITQGTPLDIAKKSPDKLFGDELLRKYRMASHATQLAIELILLPDGERKSLATEINLAFEILEKLAEGVIREREMSAFKDF